MSEAAAHDAGIESVANGAAKIVLSQGGSPAGAGRASRAAAEGAGASPEQARVLAAKHASAAVAEKAAASGASPEAVGAAAREAAEGAGVGSDEAAAHGSESASTAVAKSLASKGESPENVGQAAKAAASGAGMDDESATKQGVLAASKAEEAKSVADGASGIKPSAEDRAAEEVTKVANELVKQGKASVDDVIGGIVAGGTPSRLVGLEGAREAEQRPLHGTAWRRVQAVRHR